MKNTIFPHKFWRPFLDCMPQLFFRPKYVWFPIHLKGPMIPDPSGQLAELIVQITSTRVDLYSHQILLHRCNRRMIVVTRNHHKRPSNADVTSLTKIVTWLQKYSWYHLWDHFSGLILDTSATANVWFNSDFILLSELIIQLHIFTSGLKTSTTNPCKKQNWTPSVRRYPHWHLFSSVPFFPVTHTFILFLCYHVSFYYIPFFVLLFYLLLFFSPHCYFFSCYLFSCYFFPGQNCYFFPVSLPPSRLLPFFLLLFFPDTFFPTQYCYFFSCYLFSCYFLSDHHANVPILIWVEIFSLGTWNFFAVLLTFSSFSLLIWKNCIFTMQKNKLTISVNISTTKCVIWRPALSVLSNMSDVINIAGQWRPGHICIRMHPKLDVLYMWLPYY